MDNSHTILQNLGVSILLSTSLPWAHATQESGTSSPVGFGSQHSSHRVYTWNGGASLVAKWIKLLRVTSASHRGASYRSG